MGGTADDLNWMH